MTKQNEQLITLINRLCAVEEWAREVIEMKCPDQILSQTRAYRGLREALESLDKVRDLNWQVGD